MSKFKYIDAVRNILDHYEKTEVEQVERAADLIVSCVEGGGAVFCANIGHGTQADFLSRAGGLALVRPFNYSFSVDAEPAECLKNRPRQVPFDQSAEVIRLALRSSQLRPGDVMLMGSVSGRSLEMVELALACHEMGIRTIGFTSMAYTREVESLHPSGKKLFEAVDVVIDNGAPYGDAAVDVDGLDYKALPVSGVSMDVAGWLVWERVLEKMMEAGKAPCVFMSVNREGGMEHYQKTLAEFDRRGY